MRQARCDSSFDEHKKVAGFGIIIQDGKKQRTYSNWLPAPNNNYGKIFAIYETAILLGGQGIIYTDSQIALSYINKEIKAHQRKVQTHALGNDMADLLARNGRAKYY